MLHILRVKQQKITLSENILDNFDSLCASFPLQTDNSR